MQQLTVRQALRLAKFRVAPAISMYLSTDVAEPDAIGFLRRKLHRSYCDVAEQLASRCDLNTRAVLLASLKSATESLSLSAATGGVGLFHSHEFTGFLKLATEIDDNVVVGDSFDCSPVQRFAQLRRDFYILAFHRRCVDFMLMTADGLKTVERLPVAFRQEPQDKSAGAPRQGDRSQWRKAGDVRLAMRILCEQLATRWQGEDIPLLLVGPQDDIQVFGDSCNYSHIVKPPICRSNQDFDIASLVGSSVRYMEGYFADLGDDEIAGFKRAQAAGRASTDLRTIAGAAVRGHVQSLIVAADRYLWGTIDRQSGKVNIVAEPDTVSADDLLDEIAEVTVQLGGRATVLPSAEIPGDGLIAAVLAQQSMGMSTKSRPGGLPREARPPAHSRHHRPAYT